MKKNLLFLIALLGSIATIAQTNGSGGPDGYGYTWRDNRDPQGPTYSWFDISTIGTPVTGLGDDNVVGPFSMTGFQYYWYNPERFWIGSNGYIIFNGNGQLASLFPGVVPSPTGANDWIGGFVSDLNFGGAGNPGRCYRYDRGDTICISWVNVPFWRQAAPGYVGSVSYQIILNKATKQITFNYKSLNNQPTIASGSRSLVIGIENNVGNLGLAHSYDTYPDTNYSVVYNYPAVVTYQVSDVGVQWNNNNNNHGVFKGLGSANVPMQANIKNYGNVALTNITTALNVVDPFNGLALNSSVVTPSLTPGMDVNVNFPNSLNLTQPGIYKMWTTSTITTTDLVPDNNTNDIKIISVDTTVAMNLDYSDGIPDGAGLSWNGGGGGIAVYIQPPVYPVKITNSKFFIQSNTGNADFFAKIYDDNGPNGGPGTLLDSVLVSAASISPNSYNTVPCANQNLIVNDGGVYLLWEMNGTNITLARDTTGPISRRSLEVLGGIWAPYREKNYEDFLMGIEATKIYRRDLAVPQVLSPTPGFVLTSTPTNVTIKVKNPSPEPSVRGTIKFKMGAGPVISENFNQVINPGDSIIYNFTTRLSSTNGRTGNLCVWIEMANDQNVNNDTTCISGSVQGAHELAQAGIKMYPNPSNGNFWIEKNSSVSNMDVQILDAFGRVVKSVKNVTENIHSIQATELSNGIYLIRVYSKNQILGDLKWIKQ